jgi:D-alanine-D-alanine ligase
MDRIEQEPGLPAIVKPCRLGSSIGISRAADRDSLDRSIEEAFRYDDRLLVERAVPNLRELNCSVITGPDGTLASVLEEPVQAGELLSFRDKYLRDEAAKGPQGMASLERRIPAPVSETATEHVRALACRIYDAFDCAGVVRIDFILEGDTGDVYFNEINTVPGSLAFYLWEPSGWSFGGLLDQVLINAFDRHRSRTMRVRTYDVNLLSERDIAGLKGAKGGARS